MAGKVTCPEELFDCRGAETGKLLDITENVRLDCIGVLKKAEQ